MLRVGVRRRYTKIRAVGGVADSKHLRFRAERGPGILIKQPRPATQFLELVGEKIAGDAVSGCLWLVIGKAIMLYVLSHGGGDPAGGEDPKRNPANRFA